MPTRRMVMVNEEYLNKNDGCVFSDPGKFKTLECGICGGPMNVERNRMGPTGFGEAMSRRKHLHDYFWCPKHDEDWHRRIQELKSEANDTESKKIKKILMKEIQEVLKEHSER